MKKRPMSYARLSFKRYVKDEREMGFDGPEEELRSEFEAYKKLVATACRRMKIVKAEGPNAKKRPTHADLKEELLKDPEFRKAYEAPDPEMEEWDREIQELRKKKQKNLSQKTKIL